MPEIITIEQRRLIRSWEDDRSEILSTIANGVAPNLVKLLRLYAAYNAKMQAEYASLQSMHADEISAIATEIAQFEVDAVALAQLMMMIEQKQGSPIMGGVAQMMIGAGLMSEQSGGGQ
ncbi:MAG: hypothetical protein E6Q97_38370 [Desulfurellales bacterium]|nr:MAG: hypothetical protein E6Q97_38370 [Desulfurellales bacterium]